MEITCRGDMVEAEGTAERGGDRRAPALAHGLLGQEALRSGHASQFDGRLARPRIPPGGVLLLRRTTPVRLSRRPCRTGADATLPDRPPIERHAPKMTEKIRGNSVLPANREAITIETADGLKLVGELALPLDRAPWRR